MLSFFRINDPYRLILVLIIIVLARLPFLVSPEFLTVSELKWMVIGEKLGEGGVLYVDIWVEIGPLSALVYWLIDLLFGRSQLTYQLLGMLIFFIQCAYFNVFLLRHKVYNENSYVPALIYATLGLLTFNEITLSPQLMGLTFVLPVYSGLFSHMESRRRVDENPLNIGIYTGIASLFYLPYIFFIFIWFFVLLIYSSTIGRRYLLMFYGAFFTFFVAWLLYVWKGHISEFHINFVNSFFRRAIHYYWSVRSILFLIAIPFLFFLSSVWSVIRHPGYTNYQVRVQSIFFLSLLAAVPIWLIYSERGGFSFIIFVPAFAFFVSHGFLIYRKNWKRELSFLLFFSCSILLNIVVSFQWFSSNKHIGMDQVLAKEHPLDGTVRGKRIVVIGEDPSLYLHAKLATPYFSWRIARLQLTRLDYYDNVVEIYRNFQSDMPEVIVDQQEVMPAVFEKIPALAQAYEQGNLPGVYLKTNRTGLY